MKKYLYVYKTTLIENIQYISEIFLGFFTFILVIWVFLNLWQYMYSDSSNLINGYSIKQMIWYVIVTEVLWYGTRNRGMTKQISHDIKNGNIAYQINKPYNYIGFVIANNFGKITLKFIIYLLVGVGLGLLLVGPIPNFNFSTIPLFLIVTVIAIVINTLIRIMISVLAFWIEDAEPFHWLYDKLILVLGITLPIEMFPIWLQGIIRCTPVFITTYGPAKMLVDFNINVFFEIIIFQAIYLIVTILLLAFMYHKGVKKLNVNGG